MFCPDCGRECKEANFCPDCGRALPTPEVKKIFCPDCGRNCEGFAFCPDCGRSLRAKKKLNFPQPPIGRYNGEDGEALVITEEAVVFYKHNKYLPVILADTITEVQAIPFNEIYAVYYRPLHKWNPGILSVRSVQNKLQPVATEMSVARYDNTSIHFVRAKNNFKDVYLFLKQCADIVNAAENE